MSKLSVAMDASAAYVKIFDDYISYLRKGGLEIEVVHLAPNDTALRYFLEGKVDMFWGGPLNFAIINHHFKGQQLNPLAEDTDIDCHSVFLVKADSSIESIQDLKDTVISTGPYFSAESRIIPIQYLKESGLECGRDYKEANFESQNAGIEAMMQGEVDVAITFYRNFLRQLATGVYMDWELKVIGKTPYWDHCIFAGLPGLDQRKKEDYQRFIELMLAMDAKDPMVAESMRLEGVNRWVLGRPDRYQLLLDGCDTLNIYEEYPVLKNLQ